MKKFTKKILAALTTITVVSSALAIPASATKLMPDGTTIGGGKYVESFTSYDGKYSAYSQTTFTGGRKNGYIRIYFNDGNVGYTSHSIGGGRIQVPKETQGIFFISKILA